MAIIKETELVIPMLVTRDMEHAYFGNNIPRGMKRINVALSERLANRLLRFESFGGATASENLERFIILKLFVDSQQSSNDPVFIGKRPIETYPVNPEKVYSAQQSYRFNAELPSSTFELIKAFARTQDTIYNKKASYSRYIRNALDFGFRAIDAAESQSLLFLSSGLPFTIGNRNILFLI